MTRHNSVAYSLLLSSLTNFGNGCMNSNLLHWISVCPGPLLSTYSATFPWSWTLGFPSLLLSSTLMLILSLDRACLAILSASSFPLKPMAWDLHKLLKFLFVLQFLFEVLILLAVKRQRKGYVCSLIKSTRCVFRLNHFKHFHRGARALGLLLSLLLVQNSGLQSLYSVRVYTITSIIYKLF